MDEADSDRVRQELLAVEPLTHRLPPGSGQDAVEALLATGYWEVGASGAVYRRDLVVEVVTQRYADGSDPDDDAWRVEQFAAHPVADAVWLASYLLFQGDRRTRRATLWERTPDGWRALYHQGTLAPAPER
ncbi:MAG: DUF4440 domain-containing protein [Micropruina sp.]|uniref:DUF4440 domain-containing protein n=1 Tax=Micropruina sp. TaxID=2737536 RepID=UPI0039E66F6C